jgi:glycosyltransferase involved in cell wall biosynthesis
MFDEIGECNALVLDGCSILRPKFSIMIPTYNRSELLKRSIFSALRQSCLDDFEVVVVDNCSEKFHFERIYSFVSSLLPANIRLYRNNKNIGMFQNWNMCIYLARSDSITILNDDDLLSPFFCRYFDKILIHNLVILKNKIELLGAAVTSFENDPAPRIELLNIAAFLKGNPANGSLGVIFDKQKAIKIGGYRPECWPTSDYDFLYRYYRKYGGVLVHSIQCAYGWGVNESLSLSVIQQFLFNDYYFRLKIIRCEVNNSALRYILYLLNNLQSYCVAFFHYEYLNADFCASKELRRLGFKFFPLKNRKILFFIKKIIDKCWKLIFTY